MVDEVLDDLFAYVVGLEADRIHQQLRHLNRLEGNLPNKSYTTAYSLFIFQHLGRCNFV